MASLRSELERLRTRRDDRCASDLELDRLLASELDATAAANLRQRVSACAHCRDRLSALEADREAFLAGSMLPFADSPAPSERRLPGAEFRPDPSEGWLRVLRPRRGWFGAPAAGALAAAALAAVFVGLGVPPDQTRMKGADGFGYTVVGADLRIRGDETTARARPGDELQWRFRVTAPRYVAVLSRDDTGAVSVYFPAGLRAARIAAGAEQVLPMALRLNDSSVEEEIFGVICTAAVEITDLEAAIVAAEPTFPDGCHAHRRRLSVQRVP